MPNLPGTLNTLLVPAIFEPATRQPDQQDSQAAAFNAHQDAWWKNCKDEIHVHGLSQEQIIRGASASAWNAACDWARNSNASKQ